MNSCLADILRQLRCNTNPCACNAILLSAFPCDDERWSGTGVESTPVRSVAMMIVPPRAGIDYLPSMPLLSIPKKHSAYAQNMIVEICKPYSVDCTCTGSLLQYPLSISNVHLPYTTYMRMLALLQTWMWSSPLPESDVMNLILQQTLNV